MTANALRWTLSVMLATSDLLLDFAKLWKSRHRSCLLRNVMSIMRLVRGIEKYLAIHVSGVRIFSLWKYHVLEPWNCSLSKQFSFWFCLLDWFITFTPKSKSFSNQSNRISIGLNIEKICRMGVSCSLMTMMMKKEWFSSQSQSQRKRSKN